MIKNKRRLLALVFSVLLIVTSCSKTAPVEKEVEQEDFGDFSEPSLQLEDMDGFHINSNVFLERIENYLEKEIPTLTVMAEPWNPQTKQRRIPFHEDLFLITTNDDEFAYNSEFKLYHKSNQIADTTLWLDSDAGSLTTGLLASIHPDLTIEEAKKQNESLYAGLLEDPDMYYSQVLDNIEYSYIYQAGTLSIGIIKIA